MPASDISIPEICRGDARSRSMAHEQSRMNRGSDELSRTAFTAVVACINNTGPGLGQVGPSGNYQGLSDFQTWVCSITMLLGRLELFSILVLFTPQFWRK